MPDGDPLGGVTGVAVPADQIDQFFTTLAAPGHISTFEGESASLRFDVGDAADNKHWHVQVADGDVTVSHANSPADAVVHVDRPHLEAMVTGRLNAQAALLRGLLTCEGSIAALLMFQRCLPGPPGSKGRVAPISSRTVTEQHGRTA
jgi:SCP-2 sterol transfer family